MSFFQLPSDENYQQISAEVGFIIDLQLAIETALDQRGLSQADLARLLDVSEARVSQMLSDNGANLRARTIGRIGDAIGMKPCLQFQAFADVPCAVSMNGWARAARSVGGGDWGAAMEAANQNVWHEEDEPLAAVSG